MLAGLASLYVAGVDVDWEGFDRDYPRQRVPLPSYPFQRQRVWALPVGSRQAPAAGTRLHPLLERRLLLPLRDLVFETRLRSDAPAYLADHAIQGTVVLPAAAYLELVLAGAREALGSGACTVADVSFQETLLLPDGEDQSIQLIFSPSAETNCCSRSFDRVLRLAAACERQGPRSVHSRARAESLATIRERCSASASRCPLRNLRADWNMGHRFGGSRGSHAAPARRSAKSRYPKR